MSSGVVKVFGDTKKRNRSKKLADDFAAEVQDIMCVKKSVGMNGKRGVNCAQICSLLFLFLLGGVAGNMMLLQTTVMLAVTTASANPDWDAE